MAKLQRIALVIGNSAYQNSNPLPNPVNDAALITQRLIERGYEIVGGATSDQHPTALKAGMNLTSLDMAGLIAKFTSKIEPGAVAVIYYAGHGLQVGGKNFLVPVDDTFDEALDNLGLIDIKTKVETISSRIGETGSVIVLLDACRDNPLFKDKDKQRRLLDLLEPKDREPEFGQEAVATSPTRGGLSSFKVTRHPLGGRTFIGFATAPGEYAFDGKTGSTNSPFARALGHHLQIRGLEIEELYNRVAQDVLETVHQELSGKVVQDPWSETNLNRSLYIYPRDGWPILLMGLGGLIAGLIICFAIFKGGRITSTVPLAGWFLGLLFGVVMAFGTWFWGSKRKVRNLVLAFLGPGIGFALALAILQIVPALQAGVTNKPVLNDDQRLAEGMYWTVTLIGGALYLIGTALVRWEKNEPWPRSPLGWLNLGLTWGLPFIIVGVLLRLEDYMSAASPVQTAVAMFAVLGGVIYAGSIPLALRAQGGNFAQFGPFTGAVTVGLLMAGFFGIYQWIMGQRSVDNADAHLLLVALGTLWHGLLGAQIGYCFAYYVPDHKPTKR